MFVYKENVFNPGDRVTCLINGVFIEGTIHIDNHYRMWICHDNSEFDGDRSAVLYGHRFSWCFSLLSSGHLSDDVTNLQGTLKFVQGKDTIIDSKLRGIFEIIIDKSTYIKLFFYKLKPFEDFSKINYSDTVGFISLQGEVKTKNGIFKKEIQIKLSRYLKKITDSYSALLKENNLESSSLLTDTQIEKIYNAFVAYQAGDYFKLEILHGEDIVNGYIGKNYSDIANGTLHKSCMTDKVGFLNLYTKNSNIALAVLKSPNGIEARCLLWTLENGETYYDRIYYSFEWIFNVMQDKLKKMSYLCLTETDKMLKIKLQEGDFDYYPYVDSFCTYSPETNYLYYCAVARGATGFVIAGGWDNLPTGSYRRYQRTNGTFVETSY